MIQITINNQKLEVPEGITVLQAATMSGIDIPTLCAHKHLTPFGGCRLCIVEVQGFRVPIASCTLPVSPNMVVNTETDALKKSRKFILSMLFSERNHFCPFCQVSGGDCELQNAAYHEEMTSWPLQPGWNGFPVDSSHPYFVLDNNRCILCRRCVRACAEMSGNFTLSMAERGASTILVADTNVPLGKSTCIECGSCVQVCPTGALIDRATAYLGHDVSLTETKSVCVGCSVGCGIVVKTRDNRIVRIDGDWDAAVNQGTLCKVGRYEPTEESRTRLTTPLMRKDGKLEPVSWDEAIISAAEHLRPLVGQADSGVAAIASTRLSVETLALFKEIFADEFKSGMVTSMEEGLPTAVSAAVADKSGAFEGKLDVLRNADLVVTLGINPAVSHQVVGFMVKRALPKGMRLMVIDPGENGFAELADLSMKNKPGSDLALLRGLQAIILKEGLGRTPLAMDNIEGVIAQAVEQTGLSLDTLTRAASLLANSISPVILYGKGITAQGSAETLEALIALAKLVGAVDGERNGLVSLKGEANSLAAAQLRLDKKFALNGHKAVYLLLGDDHPSKRLLRDLEKAPYLVVQASYASELTEKADIVLPVTHWAEQDGHFLNLDGRLQKATKSLEAPEGIRENLAVLAEIATRVNLPVHRTWQKALRARLAMVELDAN
jgi:formate dehydrogenase major subunit